MRIMDIILLFAVSYSKFNIYSKLAYIPYDPNQVLGVSGSYMSNSQLVQRQGPNVQPSANNYYSATSAGKPDTSNA